MEDMREEVFVRIVSIIPKASTAIGASLSFISRSISIGMKPTFANVSICLPID